MTTAINAGQERISLVTDDATGDTYYQVEMGSGGVYLCDADGDRVDLRNWTLRRVLGVIPAGDSDAFFALITEG